MSQIINIDKKIVSSEVLKEESSVKSDHVVIQTIDERTKRPEILNGMTYKLKTPLSSNSIYVTINNIVINEGTPYESIQPFEIFINSKEMKNFQWITAVTRLISAVFRKGGDVAFIVSELSNIFDPNGGYIGRGGKYIPSIVAEIAYIVEKHFKNIGIIKSAEMDKHTKDLISKKKKEYIEKFGKSFDDFPEEASICQICSTKAVIRLDNCSTCLNCGDSACGK